MTTQNHILLTPDEFETIVDQETRRNPPSFLANLSPRDQEELGIYLAKIGLEVCTAQTLKVIANLDAHLPRSQNEANL